MDLTSLLMSGAGGAILGPIISQFLGGSGSSMLMRVLAGVVGGAGANAAANSAGVDLLGGSGLMEYLETFLQGGVGGGVLSVIAGMVTKK